MWGAIAGLVARIAASGMARAGAAALRSGGRNVAKLAKSVARPLARRTETKAAKLASPVRVRPPGAPKRNRNAPPPPLPKWLWHRTPPIDKSAPRQSLASRVTDPARVSPNSRALRTTEIHPPLITTPQAPPPPPRENQHLPPARPAAAQHPHLPPAAPRFSQPPPLPQGTAAQPQIAPAPEVKDSAKDESPANSPKPQSALSRGRDWFEKFRQSNNSGSGGSSSAGSGSDDERAQQKEREEKASEALKGVAKAALAGSAALILVPAAGKKFAQALTDANRHFARFNGVIARSYAVLDRGRLLRERASAGATQESTKDLVEAVNQMENELRPIGDVVTNIFNGLGTGLAKMVSVVVSIAKHIPGLAGAVAEIERNTRKNAAQLGPWEQLIVDVANQGRKRRAEPINMRGVAPRVRRAGVKA